MYWFILQEYIYLLRVGRGPQGCYTTCSKIDSENNDAYNKERIRNSNIFIPEIVNTNFKLSFSNNR